jgi:hypothetical protein
MSGAGAGTGGGSGKAGVKGTVNVVRRTWDKEEFARKAQERAEFGDGPDDDEEALVKRPDMVNRAAPPGTKGPAGSERAYLQVMLTATALHVTAMVLIEPRHAGTAV